MLRKTQNGVLRLLDHNAKTEFWNTATLFLAESRYFNLDLISGFEVYAIRKAKENSKLKVHNTVEPKYKIKEYDLPMVKKIYADIEFIMSAIGMSIGQTFGAYTDNLDESEVYYTSRRVCWPRFL